MTGEELKALRLAAGLSQEQVGKLMGYDGNTARQYVSKLERGIVGISKSAAVLLSQNLKPKA